MSDDFDEWCAYVDTFRNAKGEIDLGAHPDFFDKVIPDIISNPKSRFIDLKSNTGSTVNYEVKL